jgi:hypothetical protein
MNLPTAIVLLVVLAMVVVAIHFLRKGKGSCLCGENGKKTMNGKCASCSAECPLKGRTI